MQFSGKTLFSDLYKILSTLSIAFICAQIFLALNVPAPYFLGSLLGVWVIGACVSHTRRVLVIPSWFYLPVIIGISVLIGTNFTPEILESAQKWLATVSIMIIATIFVTIIAFQFLTRVKQYEP
ncbi:MAG: AbrB family transcriptional regulator, partial [Alphaproteobacteria bacterium]